MSANYWFIVPEKSISAYLDAMFMSKHFYSGKKIENKSIFGTTTRHDGLRIQHLFYEEMCNDCTSFIANKFCEAFYEWQY